MVTDSELAKIKSDIALAVYRAIQEKGLTQKATASIMGVAQAKVSAIVRGITKGYTVERLMLFSWFFVDLWEKPAKRVTDYSLG